jgi:hypothetical protein
MATTTKRASVQQQVSVQSDPETAAGVYSNLMMINHRKEEFILDFLFVQPQQAQDGQVLANLRTRVVTSPEHLKRIARAVQENIRRYEDKYGPIEEATDMPKALH